MKGKDLSSSAMPYFNSKLKLSFKSKSGGDQNPEAKRKTGTYDWWKAARVFTVPEDASDIQITIGLQDVTGSYWVKDLKVICIPVYEGQAYTPSKDPLQKVPKFRGIDTSRRDGWKEEDFIELKKWNVNIIRYQMLPFKTPIDTCEKFLAWIDIEMQKIDAFLVLAEKYGMKAVIDLQVGPGTNNSELGSNQMSWDKRDQDCLMDVWRKLAAHYKGNKNIYAYDILNEPREDDYVYDPNGGVEWQLLAERAVKVIREIDSETPIIVEAISFSNPSGFLTLKPIPGKNLIYSPHFYEPGLFTHQGIYGIKLGAKYPGKIGNDYWDKERIRKELQTVVDFQKKYNVPIYIGEFSVARWAEGGDQWLKDVVEVFEENGWDWCYHAFREYHGWSLEHEGTDVKTPIPSVTNPRKEVMLKFFELNKK